jgi:hypothetical protein
MAGQGAAGEMMLAVFLKHWQSRNRAAPPGEVARKLYVLCTDPPLPYLRQFYERAAAAPDWQVAELATGHDAMITQPEILARLLAEWGPAYLRAQKFCLKFAAKAWVSRAAGRGARQTGYPVCGISRGPDRGYLDRRFRQERERF